MRMIAEEVWPIGGQIRLFDDAAGVVLCAHQRGSPTCTKSSTARTSKVLPYKALSGPLPDPSSAVWRRVELDPD
jgi:hypothetical protein